VKQNVQLTKKVWLAKGTTTTIMDDGGKKGGNIMRRRFALKNDSPLWRERM